MSGLVDTDCGASPFMPAALSKTQVGIWEYAIADDRFCCDPIMAALYGLTEDESRSGVSMARIKAAVHPADRQRSLAKFARIVERGGLFIVEYRTLVLGIERWILVRGHYEMDMSGATRIGRGIVIDITDCKEDGYAQGLAHFLSEPTETGHLNYLAELAITSRRLIDELGGKAQSQLRPLIDALMVGIGKRLAAGFLKKDADHASRKSDRTKH
jgi:hypothetical protein